MFDKLFGSERTIGQILDKLGVRGIFECCKGPKGSQPYCTNKEKYGDSGLAKDPKWPYEG